MRTKDEILSPFINIEQNFDYVGVNDCELAMQQYADEFAIEFENWFKSKLFDSSNIHVMADGKELLKLFKQEQKLK